MSLSGSSTGGVEEASLQSALDHSRPCLELASQSPAAHSWLKNSLETGEGTTQVYNALEKRIAQPAFLDKLAAAKHAGGAVGSGGTHGDEVLHASWWQMGPEDGPDGPDANEGFTKVVAIPPEPLDSGYVVVQKEDVLDAIGSFVATYLASLPEAQNLEPRELQKALISTFQELRKGRVRRLWEWGRCLYRCIAFSYGAFSVYENPWLVRAVLAALWTSCRFLIGALL